MASCAGCEGSAVVGGMDVPITPSMIRYTKLKFVILWLACIACTGCSTLGLPSNPVAHVMTDDTKEVLSHSPRLSSVPRELAKSVAPNHFLQPGDELLIETTDADSDILIPADQRVMTDGSIDLGKYGRIIVASMTLEQAESLIQQTVASIESKSVAINVRLIQPVHRFYVVGEVNSPGAYPLVGHETVLDAIMEAGGLTARASACDILLARPTEPCSCRIALPVCYRAITQLGDTTTNFHLHPGDRIFVGRESLCEEMRSYCGAGSTCERCCSKQIACRDPNMVPLIAADFVGPTNPLIAAPAVPIVASDGQESAVASDRELIPADRELIPADRAESSSDVTEPTFSNRLDGELDFESFLQQRPPTTDAEAK